MSIRTTRRRIHGSWLSLVAGCAVCLSLSGCRVGMLLGLLIAGPPTVEPEFDRQTKESMTDKDVTVAVVCFAPTEVRYSFENIDHELAKYVAFRLRENKITIVPPDHVRAWLEEHKDWDKPEEIGEAFNTTYVIYIDLNEFSLYEEGTASLYRGRSEAVVSAWKMDDDGTAEKIFSMEKISKYPQQQPVSTTEESYSNFKGRYLSRLSDEIGRFFYEYYLSDEIGTGS
ncbi:MAG: hypothetical protein JSS49_13590 [Planctomycetes bacterium]|nr:hypothetical protein [Planctomycetota bacterium]